jgi:hypothetical protein
MRTFQKRVLAVTVELNMSTVYSTNARDAGTGGGGGQRCPFNLKDCLGEIANCQKC